jgi:hypothetical protein
MELADRVARGKLSLVAIADELLPYRAPKLMAVANVTEGSFAKMATWPASVLRQSSQELGDARSSETRYL